MLSPDPMPRLWTHLSPLTEPYELPLHPQITTQKNFTLTPVSDCASDILPLAEHWS